MKRTKRKTVMEQRNKRTKPTNESKGGKRSSVPPARRSTIVLTQYRSDRKHKGTLRWPQNGTHVPHIDDQTDIKESPP